MSLKIRRATVLGAGVMGAQIAGLLAAAGVRVHLLDLASSEPPTDPKLKKLIGGRVRSMRALLAVEQLKELRPAPLYSQKILANIIPGNFDDDFSVIADSDWVIEAVVERLDIKRSIHKRICELARPGIPVTTNTSGISLESITEELPEHYRRCFFGTHFFNPPRYMRLMEIIPHDLADPKLVQALSTWINERLGKGIVVARDTVNFIANRIGVFINQATLQHMEDLKLNLETVDALTGKLMGRPSSATFRTMDVVGLDTFAHVAKNTYERAANDPYRDWFQFPGWLNELIAKGHLGQKSGDVGCYKKSQDKAGNRVILAYRPESQDYGEQQINQFSWLQDASREPDIFRRLGKVIDQDDPGSEFVWRVLRDTFAYASFLLRDITDGSPKAVDDALRWGFNWQFGPFELWQGLGYDRILKRLQKDDVALADWLKPGLSFYDVSPAAPEWQLQGGPSDQLNATDGKRHKLPRPDHQYNLPRFENKADKRVVLSSKGASLVDLGHGVACLAFHSKMNAIDDDILTLTQKAVAKVSESFDALVVGNDADNFSAGANLKSMLELINLKNWKGVDQLIRQFQGTLQMLKFAPFPTVSCPAGLTLGGGCEVALHTTRQMASGETYAGLVEAGVGLIPAGGGTKELALRAYHQASCGERADPMSFLTKAFFLIGLGKTSTSGMDAVDIGLFPETAHLSLAREYQIERAKHLALQLVHEGYAPKIPAQAVQVVGDPGVQTFRMLLHSMLDARHVSPYDVYVAEQAAIVLCGGEVDAGSTVSEQHFLDLERLAFVRLCQREETKARIEHMLKTGKPLRN